MKRNAIRAALFILALALSFTTSPANAAGSVGTSGQVLQKNSSSDYDFSWVTFSGLPSQTGNNGKYLTTDGTTASWATVSSISTGKVVALKMFLGI